VGVAHYTSWSESDPVSDLLARYVYDHQNRLMRKDVYPDGAGSGYSLAPAAYFIYDGLAASPLPLGEGSGVRALGTTTPSANPPGLRSGEPILQFDGQGQLEKRYLYGPAVDQVLAEESLHEDAGSGQLVSDGVRWPLADHLGSIRDVAVLNDNGTPDDTTTTLPASPPAATSATTPSATPWATTPPLLWISSSASPAARSTQMPACNGTSTAGTTHRPAAGYRKTPSASQLVMKTSTATWAMSR